MLVCVYMYVEDMGQALVTCLSFCLLPFWHRSSHWDLQDSLVRQGQLASQPWGFFLSSLSTAVARTSVRGKDFSQGFYLPSSSWVFSLLSEAL